MSAPTYSQVHYQLKRERGRAAEYTCPCGAPAQEWAWNHQGIQLTEICNATFVTYGADIWSYVALCRVHHRRLDRKGGDGWALFLKYGTLPMRITEACA